MPCNYSPERDPRRMQACRAVVRKEMLAAGWIEKSKKFDEVAHRKALRLYAQGK